jgi:HTH-type transcriptional regulator / antitoxin HigA
MSNTTDHQYEPDFVSPPGETLLDVLEERGMSQAELAERTGRPKKTISEIINGKAAITPETALQLERVLGIPARFWNEREKNYQEFLAKQREQDWLGNHVEWMKSFPIKEMTKFQWFQKAETDAEQVKILLSFFAMASPEQWHRYWNLRAQSFAYRKSAAVKMNPSALIAWLRQGELLAEKIECQPYNAAKFKQALEQLRGMTCQPFENVRSEIVRLCANAGVAVVFVPELPNMGVAGVTRWLGANKALIQMSLRYKNDGSFWFTFFHESKHVLQEDKDEMFFEGDKGVAYDPEAPREREANEFSANFLIPKSEFDQFIAASKRRFSKEKIVQFATRLNIAPGIVVGRLQHRGLVRQSHCNELKQRYEFI